MSRDDFDRPLWRRLVLNRFTVVLATITAVIVLWNVYVSQHNNGIVVGRVVDAGGRPVSGATVVLWVLNFTTFVEKAQATTDAEGRFVIGNRDSHSIQLAAEKPGVGRSQRVPVRLFFRAQDVELHDPLTLSSGG